MRNEVDFRPIDFKEIKKTEKEKEYKFWHYL